MYREVLVPTNGSEATEHAIDHTLDLAETCNARVHALYVIGTSIYTSFDAGTDVVIDTPEREGNAATRHVHEAAEEADIDVQTEVVTGIAYHPIREYINGHDIDLVAMGTHGHAGLSHYLLGSVTERVIRISSVPVLTVRLDSDEGNETDAADETTDADADAEEQADNLGESRRSLDRRGR